MSQLLFSDLALIDLTDIWHYSADQWSVRQADHYIASLRQTCRDLAAKRRSGISAGDIMTGYFRLLAGSHAIFYRFLEPNGVEVIRILHQSVDAPSHLQF